MADQVKRFLKLNFNPVFSAVIVILPLVIFGTYFCWTTYNDLENFTISKRQALSQLSAVIIKERFNRLIDVGNSLAGRVQFRILISQGKWDDAMKIIATVPQTTPFIERVALLDMSGILKALAPDFPGIVGNSFANRDYYQGASKDWQPYISEVFKGATNQNSIVFAIPIKSDDNKILGILVLQVVTDTILDWAKNIDVGPGGFVYFVDRKGNLVAHPHYSPQGEIVSFVNVPVVEKLLRGEEGAEISYNSLEKEARLSAYSPVPGYGFGVVVAQPTRIAFDQRNKELIKISLILFTLITGLFISAYFIFKNRLVIAGQRDREKVFLESIGDGVIAIDRFWNITLWNKEASLLSGWSQEDVLGKPFRNFMKFVREHDRSENIAFIEEAMLFGKKGIMENNTLLIRKDGTEISVGDSASPIFDQGGGVAGAIIIFRDVSQERESQRLRSDFAYAAHQFRTPVTKALWNIEVALDEKDSKSRKENLENAHL